MATGGLLLLICLGLFVVWGRGTLGPFVWSFLLGWLIKVLVVRFGGGRVYNNLKPLFIGLIIGDLLGGAVLIASGTLRYIWLQQPAIEYRVFPG